MSTNLCNEIAVKKRRHNVTVSCPIIYGSLAFYNGKKADEYSTHRWTLFIRGPNDEDLTKIVSKVAFTLHPSFPVPVREVTTAPFEVTEVGWGEFEASIRIFFRDPEEDPVDINHMIKLYPPGPVQPLNTKKPVMSEFYDEIVFTNPTEQFYRLLMMYTPPAIRPVTPMTEYYTNFDEEKDFTVLTAIKDHIMQEIDVSKAALSKLEDEILFLQDISTCSPAIIKGSLASMHAGNVSSSSAGIASAGAAPSTSNKKGSAAASGDKVTKPKVTTARAKKGGKADKTNATVVPATGAVATTAVTTPIISNSPTTTTPITVEPTTTTSPAPT